MPVQPILRFAPSPNGRLHLGHAFSALFTWRAARELGGVALLRIEDIDIARCRPEYEAAILADLAWLGLSWPEPVLRQSSRFPAYRAAGEDLKSRDVLYPCFCSRKAVAAHADGTDPMGAPLYPGTCRALSPDETAARLASGPAPNWRLAMDRALDKTGPLTITGFAPGAPPGERPAEPGKWGDVVLLRKDIGTSYHLSVVLDDAFQSVTHVTRGADLYHATDLHRLLQALFDLPTPLYCHHALIRDEDARKLSKSRRSPSLAELRETGWTPRAVREKLGFT